MGRTGCLLLLAGVLAGCVALTQAAALSLVPDQPQRNCKDNATISFVLATAGHNGKSQAQVISVNGSKFEIIEGINSTTKEEVVRGTLYRFSVTSVKVIGPLPVRKAESPDLKYHEKQPIRNVTAICEQEGATIAYPFSREEAEAMKRVAASSEGLIAVGWRLVNDTDEPCLLYLEPDTGNTCFALDLATLELRNESCDSELPFICQSAASPASSDYETVPWYGSFKHYTKKPITEMDAVCEADGATLAFPVDQYEAQAMKEVARSAGGLLAVGGINFTTNSWSFFDNRCLRPRQSNNSEETCMALDLKRLVALRVNCNLELPFLCKKKDTAGFVEGFGYYEIQSKVLINRIVETCDNMNGTIALPSSLEEAQVMAEHVPHPVRILAVGVRINGSISREEWTLLHYTEDEPVTIRSELWMEGHPMANGNCVGLNVESMKLISIPCNRPYEFMCKRDLEPPAEFSFSGKSYQYQPSFRHADEVDKLCKEKGYKGAVFPTGDNYDELARVMAEHITHTDPDAAISTGVWRVKQDNNIVQFKNAAGNEVDVSRHLKQDDGESESMDCVKFSKRTLQLHLYNCTNVLPYICEI